MKVYTPIFHTLIFFDAFKIYLIHYLGMHHSGIFMENFKMD